MEFEAIAKLLNVQEDGDAEADVPKGPIVTPASFGPRDDAAAASAPKSAPPKKAARDIWAEDEVEEQVDLDDRPAPEYVLRYKQRVSAQDVFFNMEDRDNSSGHLDALVIEISLPGTTMAQVQLDVTDRGLDCRCPKFKLSLPFPKPVDHERGEAKWSKADHKLTVEVPIRRVELWEDERYYDPRPAASSARR